MTTRYVGSGGSNANSGLTWALRKLTLNGAEDTPVVAGDVVYVGPGTYRELLTIDVSGSAGNPITYIGDYLGTNTDGVGGVVRVTGSDNDQTATRANCITGVSKNYRTFTGFAFDTCTANLVSLATACGNWVIEKCIFQPLATTSNGVNIGGTGTTNTVQNCDFFVASGAAGVAVTHSVVVDNAAHTIQNCKFFGGTNGVIFTRVGGCTVRNCDFISRQNVAIQVSAAVTVGQTETVNNCIFYAANQGCTGTVLGEITEDFNTFAGLGTARVNTAVGANSVTYPLLFDTRWFFQLVFAGAGPNSPLQVVTPFDLASYSQLVNLAGTSPTTTDMRGTAVQGAQREWGALEHDTTLKIFGGIHKNRVQARQ